MCKYVNTQYTYSKHAWNVNKTHEFTVTMWLCGYTAAPRQLGWGSIRCPAMKSGLGHIAAEESSGFQTSDTVRRRRRQRMGTTAVSPRLSFDSKCMRVKQVQSCGNT